jgi:hypothetical protein
MDFLRREESLGRQQDELQPARPLAKPPGWKPVDNVVGPTAVAGWADVTGQAGGTGGA